MNEIALRGLERLFVGALRQGPGDPAILDRMIAALDPPERPRAADFGCGTGATALHLAERWGADVLAVDSSAEFVAALRARLAAQRERAGAWTRPRGVVQAEIGDMAAPLAPPRALDLIVSEASAYAIGLDRAFAIWRPLLARGGGMVVSECVWLGAARPDAASFYWSREYPGMGSTADALAAAERAGLRLVASERLPSSAWLSSYYAPLASHIATLEAEARRDAALAGAIDEMRAEMDSFSSWADDVGYVYFAFDAGA